MICWSCERALKKPGKHRAHRCQESMVGESSEVMCGCECRQIPSWWQPPPMALSFFEDTPE